MTQNVAHADLACSTDISRFDFSRSFEIYPRDYVIIISIHATIIITTCAYK